MEKKWIPSIIFYIALVVFFGGYWFITDDYGRPLPDKSHGNSTMENATCVAIDYNLRPFFFYDCTDTTLPTEWQCTSDEKTTGNQNLYHWFEVPTKHVDKNWYHASTHTWFYIGLSLSFGMVVFQFLLYFGVFKRESFKDGISIQLLMDKSGWEFMWNLLILLAHYTVHVLIFVSLAYVALFWSTITCATSVANREMDTGEWMTMFGLLAVGICAVFMGYLVLKYGKTFLLTDTNSTPDTKTHYGLTAIVGISLACQVFFILLSKLLVSHDDTWDDVFNQDSPGQCKISGDYNMAARSMLIIFLATSAIVASILIIYFFASLAGSRFTDEEIQKWSTATLIMFVVRIITFVGFLAMILLPRIGHADCNSNWQLSPDEGRERFGFFVAAIALELVAMYVLVLGPNATQYNALTSMLNF